MKPKTNEVLEMCILDGINAGWNRAYKYKTSPSNDEFKQSIEKAIWEQIYEWFDMEGGDD